MNYSKNLRMAAMGRRVAVLCIIVAVMFSIIGVGTGYALGSHMTTESETQTEEQTSEPSTEEFVIYGAYDADTVTQEIDIEWKAGDVDDFTPMDVDMPEEEQEFLYYLCAEYNIDFALVMALIYVESGYDTDVVSATNDYGLMQINKVNHEELTKILGVTDYLDPYQNMRAGCYILRKLFEKYQDPTMVLMCYNMGEAGASRLWENGMYATRYSEKVMQVQKQYVEEMGW